MSNEKKVTVIALGGNAILQPGQRGTFAEQMKNVETTCQQLAQMVESGKYKIIITHGNGPQVGNILLQNETAKDVAAPMPLYVCGAESQGLIGYMMQQTLHNLLVDKGKGSIPIATVVTQVVVDKDDQAFQ
ncbi:MAG TPA: carbamate kinase, partial [Candidatus Acetothermia bacterium]|nr:carbamate kinase [Candidatus Acetothermia bacterium]